MTIFSNTTFTWWQVGALKWTVFLIGIAAGAYWHELALPHIVPILAVAAAGTAYISSIYFAQHARSA